MVKRVCSVFVSAELPVRLHTKSSSTNQELQKEIRELGRGCWDSEMHVIKVHDWIS